ncbi:MAG: dihydrofolate reductase [Candidatus Neomarinimicrobiota bacterium]
MNLIVAYCKNRGIGLKNNLPWKLSLDMNRFKKLTIGNKNNAVIMGRNTWESLPSKYKPLPKRTNIILTTKADYRSNTIDPNVPKFFSSFKSAEHYCSLAQIDNMWVIGGEMIYNEALQYEHLQRIYVTHIDKDYECDTFFPEIPDDFELELETQWFSENDIKFKYETYIAKPPYYEEEVYSLAL